MSGSECKPDRAQRSGTVVIAFAAYVCLYAATSVLFAAVRPPLSEAVKNGDRDAVRSFIQKGANVNATEGDGATALHWAAYRDDLESAELLIRAGAKVNAANDLGVTPLWTASQNGSERMVRRLLAAGANPNAKLLLGETALMLASRVGNPVVVDLLASKGADVNARAARSQTALMWAVAQHHPEVVKVLLARGANVHAKTDSWTDVQAVSPHGVLDYNFAVPTGSDTPLLFAARVGDVESAKLLVAAGANVNDEDAWGVSVTVLAAHSGFADLLDFVLEKGADANASKSGFTALHEAIMRRDERMVSSLLAHKANPNTTLKRWTPTRRSSRDYNFEPELIGATPFWLAARFTSPNIMRMLIKAGADPKFVHHSERMVDGRGGEAYALRKETITTVMAACGMGGGGSPWVEIDRAERESLILESVKMLVDLGVDVNVANNDGRTALDAARALKNEPLVAYLQSHGAKPGTGGSSRRGGN